MPTNQARVVIIIDSDAVRAVNGLTQTQKAIQGVQRAGKNAGSVMNQFGSAMSIALAPLSNFGVALRQMGQALQSVSFLATAFISIPMIAAFKATAEEAINYNDALVRVQKTTGLLDAGMADLNNTITGLDTGLRDMAKGVATPLGTLAELAEQAGQLGVKGANNILKFVRVAEILGTTTDIAAEDALQTFGRLASALGVEADKAGEYILQLANTINYLENTTAASAKDIAQGMQNAVSAAAGFDIAAADLAGFIAALFQMGVNAQEAGTSFSRVAQYISQNIEDLAVMTGKSVGEIRDAFDTDFTSGLISVLDAIGQVESKTEQMAIASEIFGQRASRGIVLLANNMDYLTSKIEEARDEFNNGTSVIDEYVKAMSSTQSQIKVLQNNLRVLGVTLGDTFLPIINVLLKYVVPAIQLASEAFANLSEPMKLAVLAGAAFLAILGPLTMILGTLGFGIGIAISGIINLLTSFQAVAAFASPFVLAILAIGAALLGLAVFAKDAVVGIRDVLQRAADGARSWGNNLIASFAAGMLQGAVYVVNAAIAIGNTIARFLKSFSPPREGTLKDIMKWGANLINTYIEGFRSADFSAIEDVTDMISRYFRGIAKLKLIDEAQIVPNILNVREAFVKLVDIFKDTGKISDEILGGIVAQLGEMGQEMSAFLTLQLKVNVAQQVYDEAITKLREIRDLREDINNTYTKEVRAITKSGAPLLKQLSSIVSAQNKRDEGLAVLDEQESEQQKIAKAAENELDIQKELLKTQEGLVDFYLDELDLLAEQASLMDQVDKAAKSAAGSAADFAGALAGIDFGGGLDEFTETIGEWDAMIAGLGDSLKVFDEGRATIEAFFAGLRGEFLIDNPELLENLTPEAVKAIKFGRDLRGMWDTMLETLDDVKERFLGIADAIKEFDIKDLTGFNTFMEDLKKYAPYIIGFAAGLAVLIALFANFTKIMKGIAITNLILANFSVIMGIAGAAVSGFITSLLAAIPVIASFFLIAFAVAAFVTAIILSFDWLKEQVKAIWDSIAKTAEAAGLKEALAGLGQSFAELWSVVAPILGFLFKALVLLATFIIQGLVVALSTILPAIIGALTGVINIVAGVLGALANAFKLVWSIITLDAEGFMSALRGYYTNFAGIIFGILQIFGNALSGFLSFVTGIAAHFAVLIMNILGVGSDITTKMVIDRFANMAIQVNTWITKAKDWVLGAVNTLVDYLGPILATMGIAWEKFGTDSEEAAGTVKTSAEKVTTDTKTLETETATSLGGLAELWAGLGISATEGTGEAGVGIGDLLGNIIGLESDSKGPLGNILGLFDNLGTGVKTTVSDTESGLDQYYNIINGVEQDVSGSIGNMGQTIDEIIAGVTGTIGTFETNTGTSIGNINTDWLGFQTETQDTAGVVDTEAINMGNSIQVMYDKFEELLPQISGPEGFLQQLSDKFSSVVTDIAGEDGFIDLFIEKVDELAVAMYGEGGEWDGYLGKIKEAWHNLGAYIGGVVGQLQIDIDNLLGAMRELYEKSVQNSYIPDMAKGVVKWFTYMTDATTPLVTDWTQNMGAQMSTMASAPGISAAGVSSGGDDEGGFAAFGPLIQIDKMIVPNQQVARAFADQLSDQLGRMAGWRRTGS